MGITTTSAQPMIKPFALEKRFFEGKGLTKGDHAEFEGEGISAETAPVPFSTHEFHAGKNHGINLRIRTDQSSN